MIAIKAVGIIHRERRRTQAFNPPDETTDPATAPVIADRIIPKSIFESSDLFPIRSFTPFSAIIPARAPIIAHRSANIAVIKAPVFRNQSPDIPVENRYPVQ